MHVEFRAFRGMMRSWQALFQEAAEFATSIGADRLITISHSSDGEGVVTVWYWTE